MAFISAARSVVRSKIKCKVGTVWICKRLNNPARKNPAAWLSPSAHCAASPTSRLKKDGKALYEYARAGLEVERAVRPVTIHAITLLEDASSAETPTLTLEVACSKGTYIRTLAEDIGKALGCGAHLIGLRRIQTGDFQVSACVELEALEAMDMAQRLACLKSVDSLLPGHVPITLDAENAGRFLSGLRRRGSWNDVPHAAVYAHAPRSLLGTAHVKAGELIPTRLLSPLDITQIREQAARVH